jgi:glycosyltransferase involved in cell wall biosynthesis
VLTDSAIERAERLLGIDPERCVQVSNGFNPDHFGPRHLDHRALWRRMLVDEPRGWAPNEEPGSVSYPVEALDAFCDGERSGDEPAGRDPGETPVLLYVGRYTEVKRIPLLIEAYERARPGFNRRSPLVIVGGFPGEWEGEHPYDTIRRIGAHDVFLAGWHDHHELADILAATDVIVLPSVREQFGQVLVEGMACGLPPIAVDAYGPADIVDHGETGWLVEPDDIGSLANALVEAVNRPGERRRRGANAVEAAHQRYAWPALAKRVAAIYEEAADATSLRENAALSG